MIRFKEGSWQHRQGIPTPAGAFVRLLRARHTLRPPRDNFLRTSSEFQSEINHDLLPQSADFEVKAPVRICDHSGSSPGLLHRLTQQQVLQPGGVMCWSILTLVRLRNRDGDDLALHPAEGRRAPAAHKVH